jgi:hypothetical protein
MFSLKRSYQLDEKVKMIFFPKFYKSDFEN